MRITNEPHAQWQAVDIVQTVAHHAKGAHVVGDLFDIVAIAQLDACFLVEQVGQGRLRAFDLGRKICASLRLTIAEYAKVCGVSARTLQDVEREVSSPTLATAEKLLRPMSMAPGAVAKARQR
jgi:DNA-binding XRE family transcriptional regulator